MRDHALLRLIRVFVNLPSGINLPPDLVVDLPCALVAPWMGQCTAVPSDEEFPVMAFLVEFVYAPLALFAGHLAAEAIKCKAVRAVAVEPHDAADITLDAFLKCKIRVEDLNEATVTPEGRELRRHVPVFFVVAIIIIPQECRHFFFNEECRIQGVVPCLPVFQESVEFASLISEEADNGIRQVAEEHADDIERCVDEVLEHTSILETVPLVDILRQIFVTVRVLPRDMLQVGVFGL